MTPDDLKYTVEHEWLRTPGEQPGSVRVGITGGGNHADPDQLRLFVARVALLRHGGREPGAVGPTGLREADLNLDVARRVRTMLEADPGVGWSELDERGRISLKRFGWRNRRRAAAVIAIVAPRATANCITSGNFTGPTPGRSRANIGNSRRPMPVSPIARGY